MLRHNSSITYSRSSLIPAGLFLLCLLFYINPAVAKDSIEISSSNDFEAPEISHDIDKDITRDHKGNVTIRAQVTDEFSINVVVLFFRDAENNKYRKRTMLPDTELGDNIYKSVIPSTALSGERIEYYFEADDKVGNKKLKGLEFSPLKRDIEELALGNGTKENEEAQLAQQEAEKVEDAKKDAKEWDHPMTSMDAPIIWIPGL